MKALFWISIVSQFIERGVQAQVIACPEQLGAAPQACVGEQCGNEDPANTGHCANKAVDQSQCLCDPAATGAVPLATSIVTAAPAGGETGAPGVTGTYALATLTQYQGLRESITTSLIVSPTQEGQPAATVAAVVFAGGVAWYLAGLVGGEAAALTAPKEGGPGHEDDPTCPDQKSSCADCAGTLGFCVEPNAGCACEEKEDKCPTTQPSCEATECAGTDGKCTVGDLKDCECGSTCPTENEKPKCEDETCQGDENGKCTLENKGCECTKNGCPDDINAPFCSACGGLEPDQTLCPNGLCCKGDDTAKYKGCACYADDGVNLFAYQSPVDLTAAEEWWKDLEEQEEPICQKKDPNLTEVTAPQHINDGEPSVESAAKAWCASMDGKTVKAGERPYKFEKHEFSSFWLSASLRTKPPTGLNCGTEAKISGDDCFKSMMRAVERCEPHQKMTHGAGIPKGCLLYDVTLSGLMNEEYPPWNGDKGQPTCGDKLSNIDRTFFDGIIPQFCSEVKNGQAIKKTLTNKDYKKPSRKRAPPPSSTQFDGYKFNFEFTGGDNCKKTCSEAMEEIRGSCSATGTTMKYSGSMNAGCGTYSYSIEDPPGPDPKITSDVICFEEFGPDHHNPENDQVIRLAKLNPSGTCEEQKFSGFCVGCSDADRYAPVNSNHYDYHFHKAKNAPEECNGILNKKNEITTAGVKLCELPYQEIIKKCPWTGGEVTNVCGKFGLQSCPIGCSCDLGSPLRCSATNQVVYYQEMN